MVNEVMNGKMSITPTEGMAGTMFVGSDRYKVVCVKVVSPKRVLVAKHGSYPIKNVEGVDYYDGNVAELLNEIVPNIKWYDRYDDATAEEKEKWLQYDLKRFYQQHTYTLRQNGRWVEKGEKPFSCCSIHWGAADEYRDPCF